MNWDRAMTRWGWMGTSEWNSDHAWKRRQSGRRMTGTESKSMSLCWDWAGNQQPGGTASSCVQEGNNKAGLELAVVEEISYEVTDYEHISRETEDKDKTTKQSRLLPWSEGKLWYTKWRKKKKRGSRVICSWHLHECVLTDSCRTGKILFDMLQL